MAAFLLAAFLVPSWATVQAWRVPFVAFGAVFPFSPALFAGRISISWRTARRSLLRISFRPSYITVFSFFLSLSYACFALSVERRGAGGVEGGSHSHIRRV